MPTGKLGVEGLHKTLDGAHKSVRLHVRLEMTLRRDEGMTRRVC